VSTDRAQQQAFDPTETPRTEDEDVSSPGGVGQRVDGRAANDTFLDIDLERFASNVRQGRFE
jgi:hypothetical protein